MFTVSFPGIGIENFTVNRVAFTLPIFGGMQVYWSGIVMAVGVILSILLGLLFVKREKCRMDDLLDMAIYGIIFGVIGARLFYVLGAMSEFSSFYDVIAIWEGGLSMFGAMLFGGLAIFAVCRHKKLSTMRAFDMIAPPLMLAQIVGRLGNFLNAEAYGTVVDEDSFLYGLRMGLQEEGWKKMTYHYPVFFFEMIWNILGLTVIMLLYKKKKFDGQIFLLYLGWYGFGRMALEGLRIDSLKIGVFLLSQVAGLICFALGVLLLITMSTKARRKALTAQEYTPTYAKFRYGAATEEVVRRVEQERGEGSPEDAPTDTAEDADGDGEEDGEDGDDEDDEDRRMRDAQLESGIHRLFDDDNK